MPGLPLRIDGLHRRAWNTYSFRTRWQLRADADAVFEALADVAGYRAWWPQIREGVPTGEGSGDLVIRSKLPYDLRVHLEQRRRDPRERVLEAQLTGDIEGAATWRIEELPPGPAPRGGDVGGALGTGGAPGIGGALRTGGAPATGDPGEPNARAPQPRCAAYFTEDVEARASLLRRLAPLARPAFIANHTAMMRDGQRGLARYLAGLDAAPDLG